MVTRGYIRKRASGLRTIRWMVSQLVGSPGFPDCKDRPTLKGVHRNDTNRNKEMKDDCVKIHSPN